jgi:predicted DNA binding CopG/RHH family protein
MRRIKLTRQERTIEEAIERGEYVPASKEKFEEIAAMLARYRKDAVLHMRVNGNDLRLIKEKAHKLGVKYQTLISEFLHRLAVSK